MQTAQNGNENSTENGGEYDQAGFRKPNCRINPASPRKNPKSSPRDVPQCMAPPNTGTTGQKNRQGRPQTYRRRPCRQTAKADCEGRPRRQTAKADQKDKTRKENRVRQTGRTEKAETRQ